MSLITNHKSIDGAPLRIYRRADYKPAKELVLRDLYGNELQYDTQYSLFKTVTLDQAEYGVVWAMLPHTSPTDVQQEFIVYFRYLAEHSIDPNDFGLFLLPEYTNFGPVQELVVQDADIQCYCQTVDGLIRNWFIDDEQVFVIFHAEEKKWVLSNDGINVMEIFQSLEDAAIHLRFNAIMQPFF